MSTDTESAAPTVTYFSPKMKFFEAHTNPQKPPLLPPHVSQKLVLPVTTTVIAGLILCAIKPPFVQKKTPKNQPTGQLKISTVFMWSLMAGLSVFVLPYLVQWFKKTASE
jgi:hypothetical protein